MIGGHLGASVSALLDGQLPPETAERMWLHVHQCAACRRQVEHEGWVKQRLASLASHQPPAAPPEPLVGSLRAVPGSAAEAWAHVTALEERDRSRRRLGLAVAGAGSVSAAVLGLAVLTGGGTGPTAPPAAELSRPATPLPSPVASVSRDARP